MWEWVAAIAWWVAVVATWMVGRRIVDLIHRNDKG